MANEALKPLSLSNYPLDEVTLESAKNLVESITSGDSDRALDAIARLASLHESALFQELGKLTREFHEALNTFSHDDRIAELAEDDIPDAKVRLSYVIEKTDEAAHRTLSAVENSIPICENFCDASSKLQETWLRFRKRELTPEEFRELARELEVFFVKANSSTDTIKSDLNQVLMAQDFQDITGQIIKRVINLVAEVETSLVGLVKLGGGLGMQKGEKDSKTDGSELEGPAVPGVNQEIASQDDVDDLLSSLGF